MGEYFHYVNHDKQLQYGVGNIGGEDKFNGIGRGLGARCFGLLLSQPNDRAGRLVDTMVGSWIGDRVECIGDHGKQHDEFVGYQNITANVMLMLLRVDGPKELLEVAQKDDNVFAQLVYLMTKNALLEFRTPIEQNLGADWGKRYKYLRKEQPWIEVYDLISSS